MNRYERQAIRSATRVALLTALTCGAMLTGCAAEQRPSSLPRLVALVPANFDTGTHEELKPGLEPTMRLLRMFLKHNHAEVIDIPMVEFQEAYLAALGGEKPPAPDSPEYAAVMGSLLEEFSPRPGDSVLLVPHVMSRHAELVGSRGKWDGVIQPVQVDHPFPKEKTWGGCSITRTRPESRFESGSSDPRQRWCTRATAESLFRSSTLSAAV